MDMAKSPPTPPSLETGEYWLILILLFAFSTGFYFYSKPVNVIAINGLNF